MNAAGTRFGKILDDLTEGHAKPEVLPPRESWPGEAPPEGAQPITDPRHQLELRLVDAVHASANDDPHGAIVEIGELHSRLERLEVAVPVEFGWHLATAEARAWERLGNATTGRRGHERAFEIALAHRFAYGTSRSRLHLARSLAQAGDGATAIDMITVVIADAELEGGLSGQAIKGLATATLGLVLHDMRAGPLAGTYLDLALSQIGVRQRRTRIDCLQALLQIAVTANQVQRAAGALAELEVSIPTSAEHRDEMLRAGRAELKLVTGDPAAALAILGDGFHRRDSSSNRPPDSTRVQLLRLRALNQVGRHREVTQAPASAPTEILDDSDVLREVAKAHEALGDLRETFELEQRAFAIDAERTIGMTALLPVVDELAMSRVLTGATDRLKERSQHQELIDRRFNALTENLFDDLLSRVDAIDATVRRARGTLTDDLRLELTERAHDLSSLVTALDQRPSPQPNPNMATVDHVLERVCRTLEPSATKRSVRLERARTAEGTEPGAWQHYTAWRDQIADALRNAPTGSVLTIAAADGELAITISTIDTTAG